LHWLIPVEYLLSKEFPKVLIVRSQHLILFWALVFIALNAGALQS
jgi:hypothetical protein